MWSLHCEHNPRISAINNHAAHTWIVISGWALDVSCVIKETSSSNYVGVSFYDPSTLHTTLDHIFKHLTGPYSIAGFSLGGLWLSQHLHFFEDALHVHFSGCRFQYSMADLQPLLLHLNRNQTQCLNDFYRNCSVNKRVCEQLTTHHHRFNLPPNLLRKSLQYLAKNTFNDRVLLDNRCQFAHGALDRIAPVKELHWVPKEKLTLLKRTGHCCLLTESLDDLTGTL